ncbi:hypothetical protein SORBI_3010G155000 [Sorghum bicolor]|uniref:NAC domain-containing protein n=1 Tax=Sorghum bicolor TaxID=4558 RepID=A0A1W0VT87_SORBI|nr:hypothetical protein SORBI_3010G155000 [Sorghum bicolor]
MAERCRIGTGPQNEWYFFSHKDMKYPTGTRTNRATTVGFWKATGRDKGIFLGNSRRISLRKTLVSYIGRAPHGKKTDWIMHEYRLDEENIEIHEDGWVVCRVFKKNYRQGGPNPAEALPEIVVAADDDEIQHFPVPIPGSLPTEHRNNPHLMQYNFPSFDPSLQLPQLMSADQHVPTLLRSQPGVAMPMSSLDVECSQNLTKLTSNSSDGMLNGGDWLILDMLLILHQNLDQLFHNKVTAASSSPMTAYYQQFMELGSSSSLHRLPVQYTGSEAADFSGSQVVGST